MKTVAAGHDAIRREAALSPPEGSAVDRDRTTSGRFRGARKSVQALPPLLKIGTDPPITHPVGPVRRLASAGLAVFAVTAAIGCGEEEQVASGPAMSSPRVAMTVSYPGFAPFALITYRDGDGRRCHGLGSLTAYGPRVIGALEEPLSDGLATRGRCLDARDGDVSLQVRKAGRYAPRIVGGIARAGVTRVVVGGQAVRPRSGGEFLVVQPADAAALASVQLEYRAGHHKRLPVTVS